MFNVIVEIKAPEIVELFKSLIKSLTGDCQCGARVASAVTLETLTQHATPESELATPQALQPVLSLAPTQATPTPGLVPTAPQTSYTMEQLAIAATQLVDAGRRVELVSLLETFGVQALTALPKEQYGNFATHLRTMGAKI